MAAMELLCHWVGMKNSKLPKEIIILLEAELFARVCRELMEFFREQHKDYFNLMKFSIERENSMLESNFVRLIIKDILATEEYNLQRFARYTDTPEDVIQEVIDGRNTSPSAILLRRSIDLHRSVRRDLYHLIVKKIGDNIHHAGLFKEGDRLQVEASDLDRFRF